MTEPAQGLASYALNRLSALDRRLWGRGVVRAINNPASMFWKRSSKMGLDAAIVAEVATNWILSAAIALLAIPVQFIAPGPGDVATTLAFGWILFVAVKSFRRFWRAYGYQRIWKRDKSGPALPPEAV